MVNCSVTRRENLVALLNAQRESNVALDSIAAELNRDLGHGVGVPGAERALSDADGAVSAEEATVEFLPVASDTIAAIHLVPPSLPIIGETAT